MIILCTVGGGRTDGYHTKQTRKNISGLSIRLMPSEEVELLGIRQILPASMWQDLWPKDDIGSNYVRTSRTVNSWGMVLPDLLHPARFAGEALL